MPFDPPLIAAGPPGPTIAQVSQTINVPFHEIAALYPVNCVASEHEDRFILVELQGDHLRPAGEAVILLEVVCHASDASSSSPEVHRFHSRHISRNFVSNEVLLGALRLDSFVRMHCNLVRVLLNGAQWPTSGMMRRRLYHGDRITVHIDRPTTPAQRADLADWLLGQGLSLWPSLLAELPESNRAAAVASTGPPIDLPDPVNWLLVFTEMPHDLPVIQAGSQGPTQWQGSTTCWVSLPMKLWPSTQLST